MKLTPPPVPALPTYGAAPKHRLIGLLGGSFNPAHAGHLHITREAVRHLGLDEVWWLVSPQNPLKSVKDMASLSLRWQGAQDIVMKSGLQRVRVLDIESDLQTRYAVDTVKALQQRNPHSGFVWLTGQENFAELPRWRHWQIFVKTLPIAVFRRWVYNRSMLGLTHGALAPYRLDERQFRQMCRDRHLLSPNLKLPVWALITSTLNPISSTHLRSKKETIS